MPLIVRRARDSKPQDWVIEKADEKLAWRARLPGASGYDRAAHALRVLSAGGAEGLALLPLAMPTSWMVNARATSRAFQRWREQPAHDAWSTLLARLGPMTSLDDWLAFDARAKDEIVAVVAVLASGYEGSSLCAVTKVLSLLRPQLVPLMDDAAIAFALGTIEPPSTADDPLAPPTTFAPMLDWFAEAVRDAEDALVDVAIRHTHAVLDAPQVLDRLLWFDSWGYRLAPDTLGG
jgi:hypothetical protein